MHDSTAFGAGHWQIPAEADNQPAGRTTAALLLDKPHAVAAGCLEPFDLLRPERRALPLLGRMEELAALRRWLRGPAPWSMLRIVGEAGTGKTRLAIELCRGAEAEGWSAGFATMEAVAGGAAEPDRRGQALLVVIDRAAAGHGLPTACRPRAAGDARPGEKLRLLLLAREPVGPDDAAETMRLHGLGSPADRQALLGQAMAMAARLVGLPACPPPGAAALGSGEPLHLLLAALVAPHQGVTTALARSPAALAAELAATERARLERFAWRHGLDPVLVVHLVACVTLQDGCPVEAAPGLVGEEAEAMGMHLPESAEHVADALADVLLAASGRSLEPLGPAPIGEALLAAALARHSPERQAAIIGRARRRVHKATTAVPRRAAALEGDGDPPLAALADGRRAGG